MLIGISSPYAQRGLLYTKHRDCYGQADPDVLVVQAGTKVFNPTIDATIIEQAHRDDPESAAAEWDAQFRSDLTTFVDRAIVERAVETNVKERPFDRAYRYNAFCDPSGGQHDSMTLGIAHREGERSVLDCLREVRPPFSPDDVVTEFVRTMATYRLATVTGDRYAGSWVSEAFRKAGVRYVASGRTRSEIYLDALPSLMAGTAVLLDELAADWPDFAIGAPHFARGQGQHRSHARSFGRPLQRGAGCADACAVDPPAGRRVGATAGSSSCL